ncbi:nuclear transport factor 2 family protein [Streptomyces sp. ISL-100]|uniref:nuclear transport factor 2 family protein n=1 Tax=Streptomyces sp. ISL-100 TaxID=2819173 RepID=UPI001BEA252D|nr:nuclear transport factor 2 family protein [Streptomyces sp. ISL-100]MBT2398094.1 nuclear transport factor 2 family protein [Streptomyces sp. ISL-100]
MGQAREVMDQLTEALTTSTDLKVVMECFAEDAVAITPDGEIRGRENIAEYWRQMTDAIPNSAYESAYKHESGNTAIDEGYFTGRNTGPLVMPSGETLEATQRDVRVRGCDIATVENGKIVSYRLYFDQLDFLGQLGLLPNAPV